MGGGDKDPTTPDQATPAQPSSGSEPYGPGSSQGKEDLNKSWDPIKELGLVDADGKKILCLGKTWDNKRCRKGPSANNNRPCNLQDSGEIQGYIKRLAKLSVAEVATRRADLLLDLAEAMMCLKEPDENSEWKGHQPEQAAAQAYTWRRQLSLKADLIRVPTIIRHEAYAPSPKRRRDDHSPSPSKKRQARATTADDGDDDDNDEDDDTPFPSQMSASSRSGRMASPPLAPRFGGGRVRTMPELPAARLAHGVRTLERRLREKDAIIRDVELELRETREVAASQGRWSSQAGSHESTDTL